MKIHASIRFSTAALLLIVFLALGVLPPAPALAQAQPVTLASARVDIWPEYDQPSALVIYTMTLSPQVTLPATLTVRIPASAGKPNAVAMQDVAGLYNLNYTINAAGDWVEVKFTTPVTDIRIEYYDPALTKTGSQRSYTFRWPADYTVENLIVKVQQPVNATNVTFRPDIGEGRPDTDGMTYYTLLAGKAAAGQAFELAMTYSKPDDTLTNPQQFQPAAPSQAIDSGTPGRVNLFNGATVSGPLMIIVVVGVLLMLVGLGLWLWQNGWFKRQPVAEARRSRHGGGRTAARSERVPEPGSRSAQRSRPAVQNPTPLPAAQDSGEDGIFCQKCGKRAALGDAFCRVCGTRLRG